MSFPDVESCLVWMGMRSPHLGNQMAFPLGEPGDVKGVLARCESVPNLNKKIMQILRSFCGASDGPYVLRYKLGCYCYAPAVETSYRCIFTCIETDFNWLPLRCCQMKFMDTWPAEYLVYGEEVNARLKVARVWVLFGDVRICQASNCEAPLLTMMSLAACPKGYLKSRSESEFRICISLHNIFCSFTSTLRRYFSGSEIQWAQLRFFEPPAHRPAGVRRMEIYCLLC